MKLILATRTISVPDEVTVKVNGKTVTVNGPRGELVRDFRHATLDLIQSKDGKSIKVDLWFGTRKQLACIRTVCSHIENMMTGVRKGYLYKMRFCYAHFPINVTLNDRTVEIRNFIGEKRVRYVQLADGVTYVRSNDVKDQIEISGNDITAVSMTAARIQQATNVRNKDIRKFLDGIYVSFKGHIVEDEV
ncbi:unnamed protein product [Heterosigma akashiwo]|mmetsp:Transcript_25516/g.41902  ORF Transcript_25516/g.41902 Transcript_25516/m.41902 type:complete len:190 (+) Transcript_25516:45-614(+)